MPERRPWGVLREADLQGAGLIATVARLRGIDLRVADPSRVDELGALVVLTAAPGTATALADALEGRVPILAIGHGARVLAAALGAAVRPGIGGPPCVAPVYLTDEGCADRVLGSAPSRFDALHRDLDTFDLPDGAVHLATSAVDPAPAFHVRRAYGLPFHLEADGDVVRRWGDLPAHPTTAALRAAVAVLDAFARVTLAPRTLSRPSPTSRRTP